MFPVCFAVKFPLSHQKRKKKLLDSLSGHVAPLLLITFPSSWFLAFGPWETVYTIPRWNREGSTYRGTLRKSSWTMCTLVSSAPSVKQGSIRTHQPSLSFGCILEDETTPCDSRVLLLTAAMLKLAPQVFYEIQGEQPLASVIYCLGYELLD